MRVIRIPRLAMAYGVGSLAHRGYAPGDWVYAETIRIAKLDEPFDVMVLGGRTYWGELLTLDRLVAGAQPRMFATEEECIAAGGVTRWSAGHDAPPPTFSAAVDLRMLVKRPRGATSRRFRYTVGISKYGAAVWSLSKLAYRMNARSLGLTDTGIVRPGQYALLSIMVPRPAGSSPMPQLIYKEALIEGLPTW